VRGIFSLRGFSVLLEFIHFASRLSYFVLRAHSWPCHDSRGGRGRVQVRTFPPSAGATGFLHLWNRDWDWVNSRLRRLTSRLLFLLQSSTFNLPHSTFYIPPPSSFVTTTQLNTTQLATSFLRPILHPPQAKQAKMASLITTTDEKARRSSSSSRKGPLSHGRGGAGTSPPLLLYFIHGGKPPNPRPRCARAQV
jgi:hypothetical protein